MSCCFGGGGVSKSLGALGEKLRGFGVLRRFLVVIMGGGGGFQLCRSGCRGSFRDVEFRVCGVRG